MGLVVIFDYFASVEERPINLAEIGVPQDTLYEYVPHTFLSGLINHVEPFHVIMIERDKTLTKEVKKAALKEAVRMHPCYGSSVFDDVIVLAESENSYWFFWADRDVTECYVGRFRKDDIHQSHVIAALHRYLQQCSDDTDINVTGNFLELPLPSGWIAF